MQKFGQVRCSCLRTPLHGRACSAPVLAMPRDVLPAVRDEIKTLKKQYDKTEDDLKALQSVGQIIGEVLKQLDEERCEHVARTL